MKQWAILLTLAALLPGPGAHSQSRGHEIRVTLKGYRDSLAYLGYYFGKQTYVLDSARMDAGGRAVFRGDTLLPGGIYFILYPDKRHYFEMLLDKAQHFSVTADTADQMRDIVFTGSEDNALFSAYNNYLRGEQQKVADARARGADSAALAALQGTIAGDIDAYRQRFLREHAGTLLAVIFRSMEDPRVPAQASGQDSTFAYRYFRAHYWDHVDFADARILRTPVLETRLERYFSQLVPPVPDSLNAAADSILARAAAEPETFKFVLWWLTRHYETSPYMGMDAVFVHLVEKYYMNGQAPWLSAEQTRKIVERAAQIAPNLIGNQAPELALQTPQGKPLLLSGIEAPYLLVVFWDPTCGHCQVEVPRLDSAWRASWKQQGVRILGILTGGTVTQWQDFIRTHHLDGWLHAWDPDKKTNYRQLYDVYMTPVVYLLDSRKKIVAKKLGVEQVDAFLKRVAGRREAASSRGQ